MGFKSFLKGFLWFNNMVLLLLGAAVALYAAVLLSEFDKERRGPACSNARRRARASTRSS